MLIYQQERRVEGLRKVVWPRSNQRDRGRGGHRQAYAGQLHREALRRAGRAL